MSIIPELFTSLNCKKKSPDFRIYKFISFF